MKNISFTALVIVITFFIAGCSKQPKVEVKEKIVYRTKYIYLPCECEKNKSNTDSLSKNKQAKKTIFKKRETDLKKTAKKQKFVLPKKSVKYFAPKRYTLRPNQQMNFMVGYNDDGSPFLYLEGEFGVNTYKNFLQYLKESSIKFKEIKINSNGGVVATAMQIGAYVHDHRWSTGVDKEMRCLSACGFVYFAGVKKSLQGKAVVGLHRPYLPGVPDTLRSIRQTKRAYISYWNYIRAPKSVYDEMMDVDRDNLFILDRHNINDYIDVTIK